jgi:hypothetical protein
VTADVEGIDRVAVVTVRTVLARDGRTVSAPNVAFDDTVAVTPATVGARSSLAGRGDESTGSVSVYARSNVERLQ